MGEVSRRSSVCVNPLRADAAHEEDIANWVWIDTCCVDKRSSAELSESINLMWNWYRNSKYCVAYLWDVVAYRLDDNYRASIRQSEWFTRGWTLQELLALEWSICCNDAWEVLGTKEGLCECISGATGISKEFINGKEHINGKDPRSASVAQRMSWSSERVTTQLENRAYSLFGLLDVNLPLIHGVGSRSFLRLQEELVRRSDDESLFAWSASVSCDGISSYLGTLERPSSGLFAPSPAYFRHCGQIIRFDLEPRSIRVTNRGVGLETKLWRLPNGDFTMTLNCGTISRELGRETYLAPCGIVLERTTDSTFRRVHLRPCELLRFPYISIEQAINSGEASRIDNAVICVRDTATRDTWVQSTIKVDPALRVILHGGGYPLTSHTDKSPFSPDKKAVDPSCLEKARMPLK